MIVESSPLFPLGMVLATPGAMDALRRADQSAAELLRRHAHGDWGDVSDEDRKLNEHALEAGERLLSIYRLCEDGPVWVITEADRSATTLLKPDEY